MINGNYSPKPFPIFTQNNSALHFRFTKLIACCLLGVFSVFLIPKEFVHALYGHKDSIEKITITGNHAIGKQHTHCDFLSFEASLFTLANSTHCPTSIELKFAFAIAPAEQNAIVFNHFPSLRGPPHS